VVHNATGRLDAADGIRKGVVGRGEVTDGIRKVSAGMWETAVGQTL
jgi:hypothetical protein